MLMSFDVPYHLVDYVKGINIANLWLIIIPNYRKASTGVLNQGELLVQSQQVRDFSGEGRVPFMS